MEEGGGGRERARPARQTGEQTYGGAQSYGGLPYQAEYSPDAQPRQSSFPPFGSGLEYNMPQTSTQSYGPVQPYPARQSAAVEVLSSQFAGTPQYFVPGDPGSSRSPSSAGQPHPQTGSNYPTPLYGQFPAAPPPRMPPLYNPGIPTLGIPVPPEQVEDSNFSQTNTAALDDAYSQYQNALKRTLQNMQDGRLAEAGTSLLKISNWLLANIVELGLVRDEQELYDDRTKLWNEFNTCWLLVLRKQKQMQESIATGQALQPPQELLGKDFLERMARELVQLCDPLERHGLVDYQMGVWEEQIVDTIVECLGLIEDNNELGVPLAPPDTERGQVPS